MIDSLLALVAIVLLVSMINWVYRWERLNVANTLLSQALESLETLLDNRWFSVPMFFFIVAFLIYKLLYLVA